MRMTKSPWPCSSPSRSPWPHGTAVRHARRACRRSSAPMPAMTPSVGQGSEVTAHSRQRSSTGQLWHACRAASRRVGWLDSHASASWGSRPGWHSPSLRSGIGDAKRKIAGHGGPVLAATGNFFQPVQECTAFGGHRERAGLRHAEVCAARLASLPPTGGMCVLYALGTAGVGPGGGGLMYGSCTGCTVAADLGGSGCKTLPATATPSLTCAVAAVAAVAAPTEGVSYLVHASRKSTR